MLRKVLLALLVLALASNAAAPPRMGLPPDLALVPGNARAFLSIRPAQLFQGQVGKRLAELDRSRYPAADLPSGISKMLTGLLPTEMDRVGLIASERTQAGFLRACHPVKLAGMQQLSEQKPVLLDPRTVVFGDAVPLAEEPPEGELARVVRLAAEGPTVVGWVEVPAKHSVRELAPVLPELFDNLRILRLLLTLEDGVDLDLRATFRDASQARAAARFLDGQRERIRPHLVELGEIVAEQTVPLAGKKSGREALDFFELAEEQLTRISFVPRGPHVHLRLSLRHPGSVWALLLLIVPRFISVESSNP